MLTLARRVAPFALLLLSVTACEPPAVEPTVTLTASPRTIDSLGQTSAIRILASDAKGMAGTGTVRLTSVAGSAKDGVMLTLAAGEATTDFSCVIASDPACNGPVRLTAEWVLNGRLHSAATTVTVNVPIPDAGLTLTSSRARVAIGLNQPAALVARYTLDGQPAVGASVALTTSAGQLWFPDGGAFVSPAMTDSLGELHALLADNGMPGSATVTARVNNMGPTATTTVDIYRPDAGISIVSSRPVLTVGFNETAAITVSHTIEGRAVPGSLIQLDTTAGGLRELDGGAFTSPAPTDSAGVVRALLVDVGSPASAVVTATDPTFNISAATTVTLAMPDAGITLFASRSRIYLGVNDSSLLTANLLTNGMPAVGRDIQLATTLGVLTLPDGGTFSGTAQTDTGGNVRVVLRDTGTPGTAQITATDPDSGRRAMANVDIAAISTISHFETTCGSSATACGVMGLLGSSFNEQASVRFRLVDSNNMPVPGVLVTFTLNNAPTGTTCSASDVTNASGVATASVRSGGSTGSFTVTATAAGLSVSSPSMAVRGAKPSNSGISVSCQRINLAAYAAASPPLIITTTCEVTLLDRQNNPVGVSQTVGLFTEAGSVPANVTTANFTAGTQEGRATFSFRTDLPFPDDVTPFASAAGQYPVARQAEPSWNDGPLVRNPRDGLVTILVTVTGEEKYSDDDADGVRDPTEPFYDQGEPLLDRNDNNVFDPGELYTDVNIPGNTTGVWDPPNGQWDGATTVWTVTHILLTGPIAPSRAIFSPNTFNVALGGSATIDVYTPDFQLNRVEAGASTGMMRTATKGSVALANLNTGLDGFGFGLTRVWLDAAGTGPCMPSTPRCSPFLRFSNWGQGFIGNLQLTGAALTDTTPPQADTITVTTGVRSINGAAAVTGTFQ